MNDVPGEITTQMITHLLESAATIHPLLYPAIMVDALALAIVLEEQSLDRAIVRLKASYTTILTAHAVVHNGAGRA
jgi:hypothetical protein